MTTLLDFLESLVTLCAVLAACAGLVALEIRREHSDIGGEIDGEKDEQ